jgi:hypothetical protein
MKHLVALLPFLFFAIAACAHSNDDAVDPLALPSKPIGPSVECGLELTKENLCATIVWEAEPTETTKGSFLLRFSSRSGTPMTPVQTVAVKLWMPTMGHGSSPVQIAPVDPNTYRISDVYFVMAGRWEIHVQLKNGSTLVDEAIQLYDAHD